MRNKLAAWFPVVVVLLASCADPVSGLRFACDPDAVSSCRSGYVCVRTPDGSAFPGVCTPAAEVPDAAADVVDADVPSPVDPGGVPDAPNPADPGGHPDVPTPWDATLADGCTPACIGRECGPDGCGGLCGDCGSGRYCSAGQCVCNPLDHKDCCGYSVCWFDGCGGQGDVTATCDHGCEGGKCSGCQPDCTGRLCGDDGCGGDCGECPGSSCDGTVWTPSAQCLDGVCVKTGSVEDCDDHVVCTDDFCDPTGGCDHSMNDDVCKAAHCEDGKYFPEARCHAGGCVLPGGLDCDDGLPCTADMCSATQGCRHDLDGDFCLIGDLFCVQEGELETGNQCRECRNAKNGYDWSPAADGKTCGSGLQCQAGKCVGVVDACPKGACPSLAGYGVACNALGYCEYAYADPLGWRAWDVWILVPAGTFGMGCRPNVDGWCNDDTPYHDVTLVPFWIEKYEATRDAWKVCRSDDLCDSGPGCVWHDSDPAGLPANCLNWDQADQYCRWRCPECRLCTEAEWERAARGTDGRRFPWTADPADCPASWDELCKGDDWTPLTARANCAEEDCNDGFTGIAPVGSFPLGASPIGALNMLGNVHEWVADWYGSDYYCKGPAAATSPDQWTACLEWATPYQTPWNDPTGPVSGTDRVHRGSAYYLKSGFLGTPRRAHSGPSHVNGEMYGVRCCR